MKSLGRVTITVAGLTAWTIAQASPPVQSREMQPIWVERGYQIAVDNDPAWSWSVNAYNGTELFVAETPPHYYPPAVVQVAYYPDQRVPPTDSALRETAIAAFQSAAKNFGVENLDLATMQSFGTQTLDGYQIDFTLLLDHTGQAVRMQVGRNQRGALMSITTFTLADKLPHLTPALTRLTRSIRFDQ